jgi:hypothetical protein
MDSEWLVRSPYTCLGMLGTADVRLSPDSVDRERRACTCNAAPDHDKGISAYKCFSGSRSGAGLRDMDTVRRGVSMTLTPGLGDHPLHILPCTLPMRPLNGNRPPCDFFLLGRGLRAGGPSSPELAPRKP